MPKPPELPKHFGVSLDRCDASISVYADRVEMFAACQGDFDARATVTHAEFLAGKLDGCDAHQLLGNDLWAEAKAFVEGLARKLALLIDKKHPSSS